jgi:hypothetical protein
MTVRAAVVQINQGQNRLWIDGPGVATLLMTRDLSGRATASPVPMKIGWQGGLEFDGRTIVVRRNILAESPDDALSCDELAARLTSNVEFGKRVDQNAIDLAEIECRGHVAMDHKSRDATGITSHERVELARLTVNWQSGVIGGDGPGVIRSTRFADQLVALSNHGATANPIVPRNTKLYFLRVDFLDRLGGNLHTHEISFFERVRTVYGPVDAWEQELDADRPELLPPDTLTLTSDALEIRESPLAARNRPQELAQIGRQSLGPVQLVAAGNVRIDGQSTTQGSFAATADRASRTGYAVASAARRRAANRERGPGDQVQPSNRRIWSGRGSRDGIRA